MTDLYLKFADEAEAKSVLYTDEQPNYQNIDVLGVIYNNTDPENLVVIPGHHVNVRLIDGEDSAALEKFAVIPVNPRRIWA